MDELNPTVLNGFGLKLKGFSRTRGAYMCNTDKGIKQVKRNDMKLEDIVFVHNAKQQLYNNGFESIDKFELSLEGLPYFIFDDEIYTVSNYIEGVEIDLSRNLIEVSRTLATMHKSATEVRSNKSEKNGDLISVLEKRITEMSRLKKRILQLSSRSKLDVMILKNYDYYYDLAQKSMEMLKNSDYRELMKNAFNNGDFCHNNCREENFILNVKDLYIVNFEECENNLHITDLANIIRRCIKNLSCTEKDAFLILEEYSKIRDISYQEKKVLMAMLIFPYKFLKVCNKYYNSRKNWVQNNISYSLEQYCSNKEKNENFLKILEREL